MHIKQKQTVRQSYTIDYRHLKEGEIYVCYLSLNIPDKYLTKNKIAVQFDEPFFLINKFGIDEMTILTKNAITPATISIHAYNPLFKHVSL